MSTDIDINLDLEDDSKKRDGSKKKKETFPEHVPLTPYNKQNEQQRAANRVKAQKLRKESGTIEGWLLSRTAALKRLVS